jgi:Mg2+ and Co2+ transporter CorA
LLHHLRELSPGVRVLLTSRPEAHIILNIATREVRVPEEDIREYLQDQIKNSSRYRKHTDRSPSLLASIKDRIVAKIVTGSDGM